MLYVYCVGVPVTAAALTLLGWAHYANRRDDRADAIEAATYVMRLKLGNLWGAPFLRTQLIHVGAVLQAARCANAETAEALGLIGALTSPAAPPPPPSADYTGGATHPQPGTAAAAGDTPPSPPPLPDLDATFGAAFDANARAADQARAEINEACDLITASYHTPLDGAS